MRAGLLIIALALVACSPQAIEPDAPLAEEVVFEPYPGTQWYGPDREPVPEKSDVINAISGPEHCDWDSGAILHLRWPPKDDSAKLRQYFRDLEQVFPQEGLLAKFDADVELPDSAEETGYRTDFMELWLDSANDSVAYLVFADHVEQWPRGEDIACG